MFSFSTDDLRPQDRFDHWVEVRGKSLFGVTIELERERRADFQGRFSAAKIGNAVFADMSASAYLVSRTTSDIARIEGDSLCIGLQASGPGWLDVGCERVHRVDHGSFTVGHSDLPYAGMPDHDELFHYQMLKIPLGTNSFGPPIHDLVPEPLVQAKGLTKLLAATFHAISAQAAQSPEAVAAEIEHIARLGLMARGRIGPGSPASRAALHAGYRHAACAIIDRDFHRPQLTPMAIAAELGISVRQLHLLFEPTGVTLARTLTMKRLDAAHRLLEAAPARTVAEISYACGFDSMATFYRVFRGYYGMTPGDVREAVAPR